ncbi:MAG: MFS transporter [Candidatus Hydrogenedentes bacterium]|nr:MFS transporter [Candidatus Hydrogenedentota bacterium]
MSKQRLFVASCIALVATSMSFAIRGDILDAFEEEFVIPHVTGGEDVEAGDPALQDKLVKTYAGHIAGVAFFSFGLAILFGGPLVDLLGMGRLLRLAALCHCGGTLLTIFAPNFWVLWTATLIIGAGNGLVEAVCNPLIATLYPEEKGHKLTVFHAWFPGGLVIGGLLAFGFTKIAEYGQFELAFNWQCKMALLLIPTAVYAAMIMGQEFPATERVAAGVSFGGMLRAAVRPVFITLFLVMWLTAATELGTGEWISNIYKDVMGREEGILALVWGSIIMYVLRQFFSRPVHKIAPTALIALTAPIAAVGLFLFHHASTTQSPFWFFFAATLVYVGVCFWWPTMLGIAAERCPRTGALGLAVIGGAGSLATWVAGPVMGRINDAFGPDRCLQIWAILPAVVMVVFGLVYVTDRARGGYEMEKLTTR